MKEEVKMRETAALTPLVCTAHLHLSKIGWLNLL